MTAYHTQTLTAALLYSAHDPLNFKHLATTLNMILEPAKIKFRVIHERPGQAAVLSCRKLHVAISANNAPQASDQLKNALLAHKDAPYADTLRNKITGHLRSIEVSVGSGPLPHSIDAGEPKDSSLLSLLAQMVVNHLLNMNPADAIYWQANDQFMSPRSFLAMINAPVPARPSTQRPQPARNNAPKEANPIVSARFDSYARPTPNVLRREIIKERENNVTPLTDHSLNNAKPNQPDSTAPTPGHLSPSFINGHMDGPMVGEETPQTSIELSNQLRSHYNTALKGPKGPFVLSVATMLVAPIVGALLVVYNFSGGARIRQTAAFAVVAAAVSLVAEYAPQQSANAQAAAPAVASETSQL